MLCCGSERPASHLPSSWQAHPENSELTELTHCVSPKVSDLGLWNCRSCSLLFPLHSLVQGCAFQQVQGASEFGKRAFSRHFQLSAISAMPPGPGSDLVTEHVKCWLSTHFGARPILSQQKGCISWVPSSPPTWKLTERSGKTSLLQNGPFHVSGTPQKAAGWPLLFKNAKPCSPGACPVQESMPQGGCGLEPVKAGDLVSVALHLHSPYFPCCFSINLLGIESIWTRYCYSYAARAAAFK